MDLLVNKISGVSNFWNQKLVDDVGNVKNLGFRIEEKA